MFFCFVFLSVPGPQWVHINCARSRKLGYLFFYDGLHSFSSFREIRAAFTSTGSYQWTAEPCQPNKMERNNNNKSRLKFSSPPPTLDYKFEPSARMSDSVASTVVDIIAAGVLLYIDSDQKMRQKTLSLIQHRMQTASCGAQL